MRAFEGRRNQVPRVERTYEAERAPRPPVSVTVRRSCMGKRVLSE